MWLAWRNDNNRNGEKSASENDINGMPAIK
jgi:hypothetical protein